MHQQHQPRQESTCMNLWYHTIRAASRQVKPLTYTSIVWIAYTCMYVCTLHIVSDTNAQYQLHTLTPSQQPQPPIGDHSDLHITHETPRQSSYQAIHGILLGDRNMYPNPIRLQLYGGVRIAG